MQLFLSMMMMILDDDEDLMMMILMMLMMKVPYSNSVNYFCPCVLLLLLYPNYSDIYY